MKRNYFVYNDKTYYSGTIVLIKKVDCAGITRPTEATFMYYDTDKDRIVYQLGACTNIYPSKMFFDILIDVTEKKDEVMIKRAEQAVEAAMKPMTFKEEINVNGMLNAWIWYIVIMLVATIFNERIGLWALATIVFFSYRNNKLSGKK